MKNLSRRAFLTTASLASSGLVFSGLTAEPQASAGNLAELPSELTEADVRSLISQSDLVYAQPAARSEEGIPVGNGRMGSLVWTTPSQLRFQVNRADVYANNCDTNSFFERHNDYCSGCAYLDIEFAGQPFPAPGLRQHLSVYDGALAVEGDGLSLRVLAWPAQDVIAITVDDRRVPREPISAVLRMLRYEMKYVGSQYEKSERDHVVTVPHLSHTAASRLIALGRSNCAHARISRRNLLLKVGRSCRGRGLVGHDGNYQRDRRTSYGKGRWPIYYLYRLGCDF